MNLRKNWGKHLLMLCLLAVFGVLAGGSLETKSEIDEKGLKLYKKGEYEKALKMFENGHLEKPSAVSGIGNDIVIGWYRGCILEQKGNKEEAIEWKSKVCSKVLHMINEYGRSSLSSIDKEYPNLIDEILSDESARNVVESERQEAKRKFLQSLKEYEYVQTDYVQTYKSSKVGKKVKVYCSVRKSSLDDNTFFLTGNSDVRIDAGSYKKEILDLCYTGRAAVFYLELANRPKVIYIENK